MNPRLEEIDVPGYYKVVKVIDETVGLEGIISIHDKCLGPALGGIRIRPYKTFDEALNDVLRLSRGMTHKSAMLEKGLGGGKSVIIADPKTTKTPELLRSFARAIEMLEGEYIGAEDSGCTTSDMAVMRDTTSFLVGLIHEKSSGDPAPYTAWGVFRGIQASLFKVFGSSSCEGKTVAIQGVGAVGEILAEHLFWHGARLIVADIDREKAERIATRFGGECVSTDEILSVPCDVLAPCALGAILNPETIADLKCAIVAGAANNQLLDSEDGVRLKERGILYAPDFVINAGGLTNVVEELEPCGYNPYMARKEVEKIYDRLLSIYNIAEKNDCSTEQAALSLAEYRLKYGIGKRDNQLCFHH